MVSFQARPWKQGNSHVVTVDSRKIKSGLVDPSKDYLVTMREVAE